MNDKLRTGPLLVYQANRLGALLDEWQALYDAGKNQEALNKLDEYWQLLRKQKEQRKGAENEQSISS